MRARSRSAHGRASASGAQRAPPFAAPARTGRYLPRPMGIPGAPTLWVAWAYRVGRIGHRARLPCGPYGPTMCAAWAYHVGLPHGPTMCAYGLHGHTAWAYPVGSMGLPCGPPGPCIGGRSGVRRGARREVHGVKGGAPVLRRARAPREGPAGAPRAPLADGARRRARRPHARERLDERGAEPAGRRDQPPPAERRLAVRARAAARAPHAPRRHLPRQGSITNYLCSVSIYLPIYLTIYLSIRPSICLSIYLCASLLRRAEARLARRVASALSGAHVRVDQRRAQLTWQGVCARVRVCVCATVCVSMV
jgi:hypothetical protein